MDGAASMGRRARALALLAGTALCLATLAGVGGVAGAVTPGAEVIVHPGTTKPLASGGSRTPYGVVLPPGAACPGDTAHDGYLVYSYLVPGTASPTDVNFKRGIPNRWYGYIAAGSYFGAVNTAESTGQVVGLPYDFVWTRLTPGDLFAAGAHTATWNGGIACATSRGVVTDYWNSRIVFTADASDPGGFTWKVVDQGAVPSSQPVGLWIGVGLLVVAAGAAAYALSLRRRRSTGSTGGDGPPDGGSGPGADPSPAAGGGTETSEPTPVGAAER
jgi:hypothetical protein